MIWLRDTHKTLTTEMADNNLCISHRSMHDGELVVKGTQSEMNGKQLRSFEIHMRHSL